MLHNEKVGSIAAGGRYDGLVGMFSGADVPAVGVSVGVERVFAILESRARAAAAASNGRIRESETSVLVCSVGKGLQPERMRVAAELWAAGVAAEFGYKPDPNLKDQLRAADEGGVPFVCLLGKEEVESGTVKLKNMRAGTEETLPRGEGGGLGRAVAERVRKEADEAEAAAAAAGGDDGSMVLSEEIFVLPFLRSLSFSRSLSLTPLRYRETRGCSSWEEIVQLSRDREGKGAGKEEYRSKEKKRRP